MQKKSVMILVVVASTIALIVVSTVVGNIQYNSSVAMASEATPTPSDYQALLDTDIRGIDSNTIEGYLSGEGMGMALPAELNGYPGPRHVLDLANDLELRNEQQEQMQDLFDDMQSEAIELGKSILSEEAELEQAFREQTADEDFLQAQLNKIGELKVRLRYVHLRAHLATAEILSNDQVMLYNSLRGYSDMSPSHEHHQHSQ
jgi:Spy/CpxP family protein refolding chaperone